MTKNVFVGEGVPVVVCRQGTVFALSCATSLVNRLTKAEETGEKTEDFVEILQIVAGHRPLGRVSHYDRDSSVAVDEPEYLWRRRRIANVDRQDDRVLPREQTLYHFTSVDS
jgi:hypothetical protein